jgi:hypothetical protein
VDFGLGWIAAMTRRFRCDCGEMGQFATDR